MKRTPRPTPIEITRSPPKASGADSPLKWSFSFQYFRQIETFGLSRSDPKWFVALFEKLKALSECSVDRFQSDVQLRANWRYHQVNWSAVNIPIRRQDLNWLPAAYLENEEEYPIFQFMVSRALGRVAGFWDERYVFNILLLDPLHNLQPSKNYEYKVDLCSPLSCEYSALLTLVNRAQEKTCTGIDCPTKEGLSKIVSELEPFHIILIGLNENSFSDATQVSSSFSMTHAEIYEEGLYAIISKDEKNRDL